MVKGNGPQLMTPRVDPPSPSSESDEAVEYTSLKRSLSRTHEARRSAGVLTAPNSLKHHDFHARKASSPARSMHLDIPPPPMAADTALAALQHLPTPLLVLSSLKTIVLANEAMGRLLGLRDNPEEASWGHQPITDILYGQTLSQIGIDMIADGVPIWVSWEKFLDNLMSGLGFDEHDGVNTPHGRSAMDSGETTPVASTDGLGPIYETSARGRSPARDRSLTKDTVVDVIISAQHLQSPTTQSHRHQQHHKNNHHKTRSPTIQAACRMIISIWALADQRFFTLTFTSAPTSTRSSKSSSQVGLPRTKSTTSSHSASNHSSKSTHSHTPTSSRSSSVVTSPSESFHPTSAFPPTGAPSRCISANTFTDFQKITRMKDAMLNAMEIPVLAMWKDESVVFPNQAARRLLAVTADPTTDESYDFMSRFRPWTADFERELEENENPIIKLCRTQKAFTRWQIGLLNEKTGQRSCYDVSGHPVLDEKTGEFFAGLIAFKDVTEYAVKIAEQSAENEQQFQLICDTIPEILWTTTPEGHTDYFSRRWYDYTGLTPQASLGLNWIAPFHKDDLPESGRRWQHALETGGEFLTEYRCRRHDGVWRWMLGRALPLKDAKTGKILKWFGICTDIQDIMDARNVSQRARTQLVNVLKHAQMTMWVIGRDENLVFFEGDVSDVQGDHEQFKKSLIGKSAYDAFHGYLNLENFKISVQKILQGKSELELLEVKEQHERWFRLRLVPQRGEKGSNGLIDDKAITGVVGISMEVTQLKIKEQENVKLLANESAAKEASKMKSNFLANMSHEIRTPIAGVLGMSELLMDTQLDPEQSDFAQNIQRSANSLLTVINDILDFSKIESGRLDIEEVQFSLIVVLKDVAKMLSYAAQRKSLEFTSDLQLGDKGDLGLLGDPGRIRQILTNLLTNSIKFTSDGYVKLTVRIIEDTTDTTTVQFEVEDTGIGIEEEVKKRLFRPFSQADSSTARRFGGTGLGLTISKNLVDLMHGDIKLESKLDCGTKATFTIPFKKLEFVAGNPQTLVEIGALPDRLHSELSLSCNDSSLDDVKQLRRLSPPRQSPMSGTSVKVHRASQAPSSVTPSPNVQRDKFHVLIVEDNPVNQQIALRFIRSLKFSVSAVWNGKEALEYLLKATDKTSSTEQTLKYPVPNLILMDCQMPILDGYHTTHVLRHHLPYCHVDAIRQTPIVAMTASAIQGDREKCERAGMDDYLAKPVNRTTLEKMILKWVSRAVHSRPPIPDRTPSGDSESSAGLKPTLSRAETDHSSGCADIDNVASEFYRSRTPIPPTVEGSEKRPTMPSKQSSVQQQRRSSLSRSILASGIPGGESEAERGMRRAELEEKASSLRDAKLLAATEPGAGVSGIRAVITDQALQAKSPNMATLKETVLLAGGHYPDADIDEADESVMALTEENVEKLNRDHTTSLTPGATSGGAQLPDGHSGYFGDPKLMIDHVSRRALADEVDSNGDLDSETYGRPSPVGIGFKFVDIPGPPPHLVSAMREVAVPADAAAEFMELKGGRSSSGQSVITTQSSGPRSSLAPRPNIIEAGTHTRLSPSTLRISKGGRKPSDWSNSTTTIRPDHDDKSST